MDLMDCSMVNMRRAHFPLLGVLVLALALSLSVATAQEPDPADRGKADVEAPAPAGPPRLEAAPPGTPSPGTPPPAAAPPTSTSTSICLLIRIGRAGARAAVRGVLCATDLAGRVGSSRTRSAR